MAKKKKEEFVKDITNMEDDFAQWYTDIVLKAELVDYTSVKGCLVIRPAGYAIWENMKNEIDRRFKETGIQNCYLPMFIPESLLQKEADHVEGFAPEVAWVTHGGLEELEERLCVRPTSETLFCDYYSKVVKSYRDLPQLLNQWCSVVRWEKTTRPFLRSREFLWQEGHTAHATKAEALEEAEKMMNVYATFVENFMAVPVIKGLKTESERFAGADETFCIEAMMQDGKALQAGTSHFLGQNFAKAFEVKYATKEGKQEYVWASSWGVSTRLMGALIMTHSDDNGLVLPPKLAPIQVVIVPIYKGEEQLEKVRTHIQPLVEELKRHGISVKFDDRDTQSPGFKFHEYELKGVPVRLAVGQRDIEHNTFEVARRDTLTKETVAGDQIVAHIEQLLEDIQANIYSKALEYRNTHITEVNSYDEFKELLETKGGFLSAHWDGTPETEERIKEETKATIRCIPLDAKEEAGVCIYSGKPSTKRVLFAKAY